MTLSTSSALELVRKASSLPEVLGSLAPAVRETVPEKFELAKPVAITAKIESAVGKLFAAYPLPTNADVEVAPGVTVTERRQLTPDEVASLDAEREAMDAIDKYIKARKEAHRVMVFNHLDVVAEAEGTAKPELLDSKRHYLIAGEITTPSGDHRLTRQLSEGGPTLLVDKLQEVGDDPEVKGFDHEDFLACTTAVRVIDEAKTLLHLRKKPEIVEAIAKAIQPGKITASHYRR